MNRDQILAAPSMPPTCPAYPRGPFRFVNREYLIITYETDLEAVTTALPEPLEPLPGQAPGTAVVSYDWMKMPDSSGFGDYQESGICIVATLDGELVNYTAQMYLDDEPPIAGGREIWGFPKKYGEPRLKVVKDTLTGTLHYADQRVAMGTMTYKTRPLDRQQVQAGLSCKLNVNLKLIPDADGGPKIAQLVGYRLEDVVVHGAWEGDARLHLVPHVNCAVADFPVRRIISARHQFVDFTLPYGRVLHDYLARTGSRLHDNNAPPRRESLCP